MSGKTVVVIQGLFLAVQLGFTAYSASLWARSRGKAGMTPVSTPMNLLVAGAVALYAASELTALPAAVETAARCVPFALAPFLLYVMGCDIVNYFRYKALLRMARQKYRETGEKSDISVPGYTSLNTLMLGVVVALFGVFAAGVGLLAETTRGDSDTDDDAYLADAI